MLSWSGLKQVTYLLDPRPLAPLPGPWADFRVRRWGVQASKHVWIYIEITLCIETQHLFVGDVGFWMARGKTECGLDGEHGRLLETAEMREVDLYIQLVVYRKGEGILAL